MQTNVIHNKCCLIGMAELPDACIDLIIADNPYGTTKMKWDKKIDPIALWAQYKRLIKPNGAILLFAQQPFATELITTATVKFRYELIWQKTQKMGFFNANLMPLRAHENILVFYKRQPFYKPKKQNADPSAIIAKSKRSRDEHAYEGYGADKGNVYIDDGTRFPSSVMKYSNWNGVLFGKDKGRSRHRTQKPVPLLADLIEMYCQPGSIVLDNASGSGSTAVACIEKNMQYICFEKDPAIHADSIARISIYNPTKKT